MWITDDAGEKKEKESRKRGERALLVESSGDFQGRGDCLPWKLGLSFHLLRTPSPLQQQAGN